MMSLKTGMKLLSIMGNHRTTIQKIWIEILRLLKHWTKYARKINPSKIHLFYIFFFFFLKKSCLSRMSAKISNFLNFFGSNFSWNFKIRVKKIKNLVPLTPWKNVQSTKCAFRRFPITAANIFAQVQVYIFCFDLYWHWMPWASMNYNSSGTWNQGF